MRKILYFFFILLVFIGCSKTIQSYDLMVLEYMNDPKITTLSKDIYSDGKNCKNVNKVFYNVLYDIDTNTINKQGLKCDNLCYFKLAKSEAIMLIVKDGAMQDSLPFNPAPFYKWKEFVIKGENPQPYLDDLLKQYSTPSN